MAWVVRKQYDRQLCAYKAGMEREGKEQTWVQTLAGDGKYIFWVIKSYGFMDRWQIHRCELDKIAWKPVFLDLTPPLSTNIYSCLWIINILLTKSMIKSRKAQANLPHFIWGIYTTYSLLFVWSWTNSLTFSKFPY